MPGSAFGEMIFIIAMMIVILVISFAAVFFFVRQYRREVRRDALNKQKPPDAD